MFFFFSPPLLLEIWGVKFSLVLLVYNKNTPRDWVKIFWERDKREKGGLEMFPQLFFLLMFSIKEEMRWFLGKAEGGESKQPSSFSCGLIFHHLLWNGSLGGQTQIIPVVRAV